MEERPANRWCRRQARAFRTLARASATAPAEIALKLALALEILDESGAMHHVTAAEGALLRSALRDLRQIAGQPD